jgi:2-isopropylmalate synthase
MAIAYTELPLADGSTLFGVGINKNIVVASLKAVVSGVNRALQRAYSNPRSIERGKVAVAY